MNILENKLFSFLIFFPFRYSLEVDYGNILIVWESDSPSVSPPTLSITAFAVLL